MSFRVTNNAIYMLSVAKFWRTAQMRTWLRSLVKLDFDILLLPALFLTCPCPLRESRAPCAIRGSAFRAWLPGARWGRVCALLCRVAVMGAWIVDMTL